MSKEVDTENFKVYKFKTDGQLFIAIPKPFLLIIDDAVGEHGGLEKVPDAATVRGVFVQKNGDKFHYIDNNEQQNDITINQLVEL